MTTWNDVAQSNDARREAIAIAERDADATGFDETPLGPWTGHVSADETERARKDASVLGIGFVHRGVRLDPADVVVHRRFNLPDGMTSGELWNMLEQVLIDKGASPDWIAYALPDLQIAASQYASSQWGAGHRSGAAGEPMPNPQPVDEFTPGVEPIPTTQPVPGVYGEGQGRNPQGYTQTPAEATPEHLRWTGEGPQPARFVAPDGTIVYRDYEAYCDD